jgi:hypothetical protein
MGMYLTLLYLCPSIAWLTGWLSGSPLTSVAHGQQHCRVQTSAEPRPGRGTVTWLGGQMVR